MWVRSRRAAWTALDPDPSGTAPSYFISVATSAQLRLRRISDPGGTPALSGALNVTVPAVAAPIALEHLGNAHPGGTYNGKIDASDTRFMPVIKRDGVLWAAQGSAVNNTGVASAGDRDAVRWYQIDNLDTTPTLVQSGTIFDPAASNPKSLHVWHGHGFRSGPCYFWFFGDRTRHL